MPCWFDLVRYLRIYLRTLRSYVRVSTPFCRFARALDCGVGHTNINSKFSDQCESQTDFSAILVRNFVIKVYVQNFPEKNYKKLDLIVYDFLDSPRIVGRPGVLVPVQWQKHMVKMLFMLFKRHLLLSTFIQYIVLDSQHL